MESGELLSALKNAAEAEQICREFGMNDLLVGIRALIGRVQLRLGHIEEAADSADRAMREIRPGVELAHLVPLALSEVAEARGDHEEAGRLIDMAYKQLTETLAGLPQPVRAQSLENVPSHRSIAEAWRRRQPEVAIHHLPSVDSPAGRTLTPEDLSPVEWTIHDPSDNEITDRLQRRRRQIMRLLAEAEAQRASPTVEDLAAALGSSSATIRRDLAALRAAGHSPNTRGSR
jgi:hypothetical protein